MRVVAPRGREALTGLTTELREGHVACRGSSTHNLPCPARRMTYIAPPDGRHWTESVRLLAQPPDLRLISFHRFRLRDLHAPAARPFAPQLPNDAQADEGMVDVLSK